MNIDLPTQYDPKSVEAPIYQKWLDAKSFHATPDARTNKFSIVIPPPNVTGALHLGHAINGTIQDVLTRYHRMKGDNTLWIPGIDHAGIATQAVVEKTIFEKEKKSRHDLGRDELVRRIWQWKEQFGARILNQLQSVGLSCDWDRARFTLDDICAKAVREAFFKMFKDGLIFRGKRLVNWDAHLQTAVADDEIYHEEIKGQMTSIRYPVSNAGVSPASQSNAGVSPASPAGDPPAQEYLIVATTRPETMLGDTALAVHPDDPRYKHLIGKSAIIPLVGRRIPIIADGLLVDPAFGTGVVKVTPAHDPNDYATGLRHNLPQINLLTPDGKMNENGQGDFQGKHYSYTGLKFATAARKQILADLDSLNLIADSKPHTHEVGHSDRSKTPIEPYLSDQWFVRMGDIAQSEPQSSEPRPLGSDRVAPEPQTPHSNAIAYFLSFHTYATWLHGSEKGSIDPEHNQYGSPFLPPDPKLLELKRGNSKDEPLEFSIAQRQSILATIKEVSRHRGWTLHAVNVRSNHVHAVVSGSAAPERMMNDFKSYATRRMREANLVTEDAKIWSRHGSTPYLWKPENVDEAVQYTLYKQGPNSDGTFHIKEDPSEPRPSGSDRVASNPDGSLPNGRGSDEHDAPGITLANNTRAPGLAQAAIDAVTDGRVKITPDRYAKGYIDWLSQKRDWCISRQLWWGHRIPVWSTTAASQEFAATGNPITPVTGSTNQPGNFGDFPAMPAGFQEFTSVSITTSEDGHRTTFHVAVAPGHPEIERVLELNGYTQDPDVLDTWFSSALWPLSTMGWPTTTAYSSTWSRPKWDGENYTEPAVRAYFQKHVFLPALNNDPQKAQAAMQDFDCAYTNNQLEITFRNPALEAAVQNTIATSMGYTKNPNSPITNNQLPITNTPEPSLLPYFYPTSVLSTAREILTLWVARMVIFGVYLHGDVPFKNVYIHAVIQDGEGRPMKKSLGNGVDPVDIVASHGADALRFTLASMATETQDIRMPVTKDSAGHNTSPKFDIGRNFANKIWNAARYILTNINENTPPMNNEQSPMNNLEDRWILSRLNTTITAAELAINNYRFADLAESLRTFFWTDLCDWYLEITKARIKSGGGGDTTIQQILLHTLRTSLKLLHPLMPFITEELWSKLPQLPMTNDQLLINAPFPIADPAQIDKPAEDQLTLIQSLTTAIREIQNRYPAAKGKPTILQPKTPAIQSLIESSRTIIETLANTQIQENSPTAQKPENAATNLLPGGECQIFIPGVIDKATESAKLTKRKLELQKLIDTTRNKLGNESFVQKAPAKIIQNLRDQLAKYEEELAATESTLVELS